MAYLIKKISNHPLLTGVERTLILTKIELEEFEGGQPRVNFIYKIDHHIGEDPINIPHHKPWAVDNSYKATVRDESFQPVPNPDHDPENEESTEYLMMPAYDYFKSLTFDNPNPVSIPLLLEWYVEDNDNKGFYDGY